MQLNILSNTDLVMIITILFVIILYIIMATILGRNSKKNRKIETYYKSIIYSFDKKLDDFDIKKWNALTKIKEINQLFENEVSPYINKSMKIYIKFIKTQTRINTIKETCLKLELN